MEEEKEEEEEVDIAMAEFEDFLAEEFQCGQDERELNKELVVVPVEEPASKKRKTMSKEERKKKKEEEEEKEREIMSSWVEAHAKRMKHEKKDACPLFDLSTIEDLMKNLRKEYKKVYGRKAIVKMTHLLPVFEFCNANVIGVDRIHKYDLQWKARTSASVTRFEEMCQLGVFTDADTEAVVKKTFERVWWKMNLTPYQKKFVDDVEGPYIVSLIGVSAGRDKKTAMLVEHVVDGQDYVWLSPILKIESPPPSSMMKKE